MELIFKSWVAVEGKVGKLGIRRVSCSFVWDRHVSGRVTGDILELGNKNFYYVELKFNSSLDVHK